MEEDALSLTPEEIKKQTEELMAEKKVSPEYLNLFCELYTAEYKQEQKLLLKDLYPQLSKEELRRRLADEQPAIAAERLDISETALSRFLTEIGKVLAKHTGSGQALTSRLDEAARGGKISLRELVKAVVSDDQDFIEKSAGVTGIDKEELAFVGMSLARPVMRRIARSVETKIQISDITGDRCPVCGGAPVMARIKEDDGKRVVECSVCGAEWTAKRVRCLACGNEEEGTLGYIFIENDSRRIDKCEKCHGYIKTADERKNAAVKSRDLIVEDAATLYLDMLAEQKGYHSAR